MGLCAAEQINSRAAAPPKGASIFWFWKNRGWAGRDHSRPSRLPLTVPGRASGRRDGRPPLARFDAPVGRALLGGVQKPAAAALCR